MDRRDAWRERERLDWEDARAAAAEESPEERLELALEISDLARQIGEGARAAWAIAPPNDLGDKARLYARPLRLLLR